MNNTGYCSICNDDTEYYIENEIINIDLKDVKFSYEALVAYCSVCKKEMYVPEVNDLNLIRAYKAQKEVLEKK